MNKYFVFVVSFIISILSFSFNSLCSAQDMQWVYSDDNIRYEVDMDSIKVLSSNEIEFTFYMIRPDNNSNIITSIHVNNLNHTYYSVKCSFIDKDKNILSFDDLDYTYDINGKVNGHITRIYGPYSIVDRMIYFIRNKSSI